jgi:hypothetical protein
MCFNENTDLLITLEIRLTQHYGDSVLQLFIAAFEIFETTLGREKVGKRSRYFDTIMILSQQKPPD